MNYLAWCQVSREFQNPGRVAAASCRALELRWLEGEASFLILLNMLLGRRTSATSQIEYSVHLRVHGHRPRPVSLSWLNRRRSEDAWWLKPVLMTLPPLTIIEPRALENFVREF